jgi:hypothetical protein
MHQTKLKTSVTLIPAGSHLVIMLCHHMVSAGGVRSAPPPTHTNKEWRGQQFYLHYKPQRYAILLMDVTLWLQDGQAFHIN